jgi:hypothetical protein
MRLTKIFGITMIKTSARKLRRVFMAERTAPATVNDSITTRNKWLDCELTELNAAELTQGSLALDKDADESQQQDRPADEIKLRIRAIELIEALFAAASGQPVWIDKLYAKQLREGAIACDRVASAAKERDDAQAAHYWGLGAQCIEKFCARFPEQPDWMAHFYAKQLREGAIACDRVASAAKERDDAQAAHYWGLGAQYVEKFCARFPEQPDWMAHFYAKQLREGAIACDRVASAAKERDDAQAAHYWGLGAQCIEKFCARFPEQPDWMAHFYAKQLREGALACKRLEKY